MKKTLLGIALSSLPFLANAELDLYTEALIGQSSYKLNSEMRRGGQELHYSKSLNATSFGLRLGVELSEYFSVELAQHYHGSADLPYTLAVSQVVIGPPDEYGNLSPITLGPEFDEYYDMELAVEFESLRAGIKGQWQLTDSLSVNGRIGLADWKSKRWGYYRPPSITMELYNGVSGTDIFYSIGANYQITEQFYVGAEYSILSVSENFKDHQWFPNDSELVDGSFDHDITDFSLVAGWKF